MFEYTHKYRFTPRAVQPTYRARIVPNNPFAFPPLHLDVQVPRSTGRTRAAVPGGQMPEVRAMQERLPDACERPLALSDRD